MSFTTIEFLWSITFLAALCYALVALLQFWLFKDPPGKKLAALAAAVFFGNFASADIGWILILSVCIYQIGRLVYILAKKPDENLNRRILRVLVIAIYGVFPVLVVVGIAKAAAENDGVIFYPRYAEAIVRSKISEVKGDLRDVANALEAYYADNNAFPQPNAELTLPTAALTTPVAYHTGHIPADVLLPDKPPITYVVSNDGKNAILISKGPDWEPQILPDNLPWEEMQAGWEEMQAALILGTYDPTNGTVSPGDIYRIIQAPEKK